MHTPRSSRPFISSLLLAACLMLIAGSAFAQAATPAPATPAPAGPLPPVTPAPAPDAKPAPDAAQPTAPAAAIEPMDQPAGAQPPGAPPPPMNEAPPPPPPPPPPYPALGGEPEVQTEEGGWNPWDHPAPGRYSHDGFFLRLTLGFGGGSVSNSKVDWSGPSLGMGLAIGGTIVENLALHADFQNTLILSPTYELRGKEVGFDGDIQLSSLGIGVTYFFMPIDLFLSGAIGIGAVTFENSAGQQSDTSAGPVLNVLFGKEWWVGSEWGIGVAAQLLIMRVDDDLDGKLGAGALNILFSATYN